MTARAAALPALFAFALTVAACGTPAPSSPPPTSTARASEPATSVPATSSANPSSPPASATPAVAIDPALLAVLPATVDGLAVVESAEGESAALRDASLPAVASAAAAALAIDPAAAQFVYALVVRLIPGAMTEVRFREWRDSYDEGVCSQANGVEGHAQTSIAGRAVYISTCAGGVLVYHVWLAPSNLLISASAVGDERRLGEKLIATLRP